MIEIILMRYIIESYLKNTKKKDELSQCEILQGFMENDEDIISHFFSQ